MTTPPYQLSEVLPVSKPKRPGWVIPVVALLAVAAIVGVVGVALGAGAIFSKHSPSDILAPKPTELRAAYTACNNDGEISDGDRTLFLDMEGEKSGSGNLTASQVKCVLIELKAPDYVTREMDTTRALDGRQSESWGDFTASWTYHPDEGLDVLIRQVKN